MSVNSTTLGSSEAKATSHAGTKAAGGSAFRSRFFVGRAAELTELGAVLDAVRCGAPRLVLIQGAAGIGKSALIHRFVEEATDARVLCATADESESSIDHAVVDQLLRQAGEPGARVGREAADPVSVGGRLLQLLGSLQDEGPVVLLLDDIQWADASSLSAVMFAVRRLVAERVLVVAVARLTQTPEGVQRLAAGPIGSVVSLAGLTPESLQQLAAARLARDLPLAQARRLHDLTLGNPLYATAVLDEVPAGEWTSEEDMLPAPRIFSTVTTQRLRGCTPGAQALVIAVAVLGQRCLLSQAAALGEVRDALSACDEATRAELLGHCERSGEIVVEFVHPLIHTAIYEHIPLAERRRLHDAAARLVSDSWASLRHRVAATPGADSVLAAALEAYAHEAADRGAVAVAGLAFVQASRKSDEPAERARRLLAGVDWMLHGGHPLLARTYRDEVTALPPRSDRDCVLARMVTRERPDEADRLAESAWRRAQSEDPGAAAVVAHLRAQFAITRLDGPEALRWSRRSVSLSAGDPALGPWSAGERALGLAWSGRVAEGIIALDAAIAGLDPASAIDGTPLRATRGWLRLVADDLSGARADLGRAAGAARRAGSLDQAGLALAQLVRMEYLTGAWDDAVVHAEHGLAIVGSIEGLEVWPFILWTATYVPVARGDLDVAGRIVDMIDRASRSPDWRAAMSLARAQLAAGRGDHPGVLAALEPLRQLSPRGAIDEPGLWPWPALYAEALVETGELEAADAVLRVHEELAATRDRRSAIAGLARVRGRLEALAGRGEAAEASFQAGLDALASLPLPYERARIHADYGAMLRRQGVRRLAREQLLAAQTIFGHLGARPADEWTARELAGCGLKPRSRASTASEPLTPRESAVAQLVVKGLSNREIADRLIVSVRTVEVHLTHIYAKVGVRSRAQLAARWRSLAPNEDAHLARH